MKPSSNKNTSVFLARDLSRAEAQRRGVCVDRKKRIDRKDWKCIKVGEFELHRNNTCSRSLMTSDNGKIQNIHYGDILVKFNEIISLEQTKIDYLTSDGEDCAPKDYIQNGDIVIADTAEDETVGKMIEVQDVGQHKVVAGLHTIFYRPPSNLFARGWLGYWMNSTAYHSQLNQYMTGIKVLSLSKSCLANTLIQYPPKKEQQQIVAALDSVQRHITSLQALVAKYDAVKKATVNLLLEPKGDWHNIKLGDVCNITTGRKDVNQGNPNGCYPFFTCSHQVCHSDTYSFNDEAILIAGNGDVGSLHYYKGRFEAYQRTYVLTGFTIDSQYCLQYLSCNLMNTLAGGKVGSTIPYIVLRQLTTFPLCVPQKLTEQRKIAARISAIDDALKDCRAQLAKAESLKQGMMSYFFG